MIISAWGKFNSPCCAHSTLKGGPVCTEDVAQDDQGKFWCHKKLPADFNEGTPSPYRSVVNHTISYTTELDNCVLSNTKAISPQSATLNFY